MIQENMFAFGLEPSTPSKKPPGLMTEKLVRFAERKLKSSNHLPLYQYGDANNNNNMNNQARILNLNLEFSYDMNYGGAIDVGGAINAYSFVSCVDDNSEYGSSSGLASEVIGGSSGDQQHQEEKKSYEVEKLLEELIAYEKKMRNEKGFSLEKKGLSIREASLVRRIRRKRKVEAAMNENEEDLIGKKNWWMMMRKGKK
ncbi:hypothetical protein AHAS_Ahas19G0075300 [Arachis hypogaea]